MSSGVFVNVVYDTDSGSGLPARVQPETITSWNPTGVGTAIVGLGRMKLSRGKRERGLSPRRVYGVWVTAPANYQANGRVSLPMFQKASLDALALDATLAYLGGTFRVTGTTNEKQN